MAFSLQGLWNDVTGQRQPAAPPRPVPPQPAPPQPGLSLADHLRSVLNPVGNAINRAVIQPHFVQPVRNLVHQDITGNPAFKIVPNIVSYAAARATNNQAAAQHAGAALHSNLVQEGRQVQGGIPSTRGYDLRNPADQRRFNVQQGPKILNAAMGAESGLDSASIRDTGIAAADAAKTAAGVAKTAGERVNDLAARNPRPAPLSPDEVANLSTYRTTMGTPALDNATYQAARQSLQRIGIDHTDTNAIDNLLGKFRTYATRKVQAQGGYVRIPGGKDAAPVDRTQLSGKALSVSNKDLVTPPTERSASLPSEAGQRPTVSQQTPPTSMRTGASAKVVSSPDSTLKAAASQGKERKFVTSVKNSPEVSPAVQAQVEGRYTPVSQQARIAQATDAASQDLNTATDSAMKSLAKPTGKLSDQEVSNVVAAAKAHDSLGTPAGHNIATDLYERLAEHGTKMGQGVQAFADLSNRTPEGLHYLAVKTFKKAGIPLTDEIKAGLKDAVDRIKATAEGSDQRSIETQKLVHMVNQNLPTGLGDRLTNIWRSGLLTGPETVAKVTASHAINAPLELASRPVSAVADRVTSLAPDAVLKYLNRNNKGYTAGDRAYTFNPSDYAEFGKGFKRGVGAAGQKLAHNVDLPNTGGFDEKFGANTSQSLYEQYPGRVHGSIFKPNYAGAYRLSLADQARAEAMNQGLPAAEHAKFIQNAIANPSDVAKAIANKEAEVFTNMQRTGLGTFASTIQKAKLGGVPIGKIIVPFTRIPTAIANKGIVDYTPLGLGKALGEVVDGIKNGTFDQRAFSQAVGRSATGTTLAVAVGAKLAADGSVTLSAPADQKERALWSAEGKQPNSIKLGNKWVSLNAMGPYGIALGLGAAFQSALKSGQGPSNAAVTALAAAGKLVTDQPYFKGIAGISNALNDPKRYANTLVDSTIGSVIPAASSQIASGTDTLKRVFGGNIPDTIKSKIPGLRETLPVQRDLYGTALPSGHGGSPAGDVAGSLNPFYPSSPRNQSDPVTQELQRLYDTQGAGNAPNIAPPNKSQTVNGAATKLTPQQLDQFIKTAGPTIQQGLSKLIASPVYQSLGDSDKTSAINKVINDAHQAASVTVLGNNPANLSSGAAATLASTGNAKAASPADAAANKVAIAKFKQSPDKTLTIGGTQYYKDGAGAVKSMPKAQYDYNQVSAKTSVGMEQAKTAGDLQAWLKHADAQYTALEALKATYDPVTQADKLAGIQKQQDSLQAEAARYNSYGGFSKGKSTKNGKLSTRPGGGYKMFAYASPGTYNKSLRSLLAAAKVSAGPRPRVRAA